MKFDMIAAYDAVSDALGGAYCELAVCPPPVGRDGCFRLRIAFRSPVTRNMTDLNILIPRDELGTEAENLNRKWNEVLSELRRQTNNKRPEGAQA